MNSDRVKNLRNVIQSFSKEKQLDIFKLCKSKNIFYTENRNGVFINLSELEPQHITEIENFVKYINTQENEIQQIENEKDKISQLLSDE